MIIVPIREHTIQTCTLAPKRSSVYTCVLYTSYFMRPCVIIFEAVQGSKAGSTAGDDSESEVERRSQPKMRKFSALLDAGEVPEGVAKLYNEALHKDHCHV